MIIELSERFAEFTAADWNCYHTAIENLIIAHREGSHIFSPGRAVCSSVLENCELSGTQSEVLKYHIGPKLGTILGQAQSAAAVIVCNPSDYADETSRANQIGVDLKEFAVTMNCLPSKLIVENADFDGRLLENLCSLFARRLGYLMPLKIEKVHGGGSSIGLRYRDACGSARPSICVVDGDQKFINDTFGDTANAVRILCGTELHNTVENVVLPVRELENCLPISSFLDVYVDSPEVRERVHGLHGYCKYREAQNFPLNLNAIPFTDLKNGILRSDVASFPPHEREAFLRLDQFLSGQEIIIEDYDDLADNTVIHSGVSENLLLRYSEFLEQKQFDKSSLIGKFERSPDWNWLSNTIKRILSFGAGAVRIPIN